MAATRRHAYVYLAEQRAIHWFVLITLWVSRCSVLIIVVSWRTSCLASHQRPPLLGYAAEVGRHAHAAFSKEVALGGLV